MTDPVMCYEVRTGMTQCMSRTESTCVRWCVKLPLLFGEIQGSNPHGNIAGHGVCSPVLLDNLLFLTMVSPHTFPIIFQIDLSSNILFNLRSSLGEEFLLNLFEQVSLGTFHTHASPLHDDNILTWACIHTGTAQNTEILVNCNGGSRSRAFISAAGFGDGR